MTSANPEYTPEFKRAVVAAYRCDPRPCHIGRRFSIHHTTVERWVHKLNGGNGNGNNGNGKSDMFSCGNANGNGGNSDGNGKCIAGPEHDAAIYPVFVEETAGGGEGLNVAQYIEPLPHIETQSEVSGSHEPIQNGNSAADNVESGVTPQCECAGGTDEIDELMVTAEKEYLSHLLKPENVSGTSTKDAAAIFKTLAEVEIKRSAHRLMLESAKNAGVRGTDGDGEDESELKPGLLDWERVVRRLLSEGDAE